MGRVSAECWKGKPRGAVPTAVRFHLIISKPGGILMERKITKKDTYLVMFKEYPDVVDVEQMSEMIGISTKTAYKLLRENKIQHFKIGRTYKIPKLNILLYINVV